VIDRHVPVVGVPAGCKIHSGVYAITPRAAGKVVQQVISGELVSLFDAEVKDIDEQAFRNGQVIARYFGEMQVPEELSYIQAVKMGGKESDELVLSDIAAYVIEMMEEQPERIFVMGSGSTVDFIMHAAGLENTLLGVDLVQNMEVIANDVSAQQLLALTENIPTSLVITLIGGQGHIFGRGNQQLSPEFIKRIGKENIHVVATKNKLTALGQKGLISDTGDEQVNASLSGPISVITGYKDKVLYFVRGEDI
jgi:predicted polyphosphate/ATP-dependent NAD kinase